MTDLPRYYEYHGRPLKIARASNGGLRAYLLDNDTGRFEVSNSTLRKIYIIRLTEENRRRFLTTKARSSAGQPLSFEYSGPAPGSIIIHPGLTSDITAEERPTGSGEGTFEISTRSDVGVEELGAAGPRRQGMDVLGLSWEVAHVAAQ
ncbi:MAG: hypothetical protein ACT4RN_23375 [Pseudonocardia sp.]